VFPCIFKAVAFFRQKDPIVMGVDVESGVLKLGTPICVFSKEKRDIKLGIVDSIESNHKPLKEAKKETGSVAIKFKGDTSLMATRHFDLNDRFVSILNRNSINSLKEHFRDEMSTENWNLVRELKPFFEII
jgi:translation initiation factor 5B